MTGKHWTAEDTAVLDGACRTGLLPDYRIATQMRLALYLGFSRQTIITRLAGRRLPLCERVMSEAGRRGGLESYRRRVARVQTIRMCTA